MYNKKTSTFTFHHYWGGFCPRPDRLYVPICVYECVCGCVPGIQTKPSLHRIDKRMTTDTICSHDSLGSLTKFSPILGL